MKRRLLSPALVLPAVGLGAGVFGCGRGESLMPLDQGRSWTYTFRTPFQVFVEPVEVKGEAAVGRAKGALLTGPMGTSRLGWNGDTLYAARFANSSFSPPLPVVVEAGGKGEATRKWRGTIEAFGVKRDAFASMTQKREKVARRGVVTTTAKSEIVIQARDANGGPPTRIEVTTWFRPGVGIVEQEQRTDRTFLVNLELLDEG